MSLPPQSQGGRLENHGSHPPHEHSYPHVNHYALDHAGNIGIRQVQGPRCREDQRLATEGQGNPGDNARVPAPATEATVYVASVNAYIFKNAIIGQVREHSLPTVADFVEDLKKVGTGAFMFSVDIERAYKNFRVDPLDWPLMCQRWRGHYYLETAMPFGARSSSANMQRVANLLIRILTAEGMLVKMYLDDLIVVAHSESQAWRQYNRVRGLLRELGLPEAKDKAQPPSKQVRWLGIDISATNMSLSIPQEKLKEVLDAVDTCDRKGSVHRRQYESLLGKLMHVAKCVAPARVFMSRLLQALRETQGWFVKVTPKVRADLQWFKEFASQWSGVSLIPPDSPAVFIQVDASLTGIRGTDGRARTQVLWPT